MACAVCGEAVPVRKRGRPAVYCSRACQARAYRARKAADAAPGPMGVREARRLAAYHAGLVVETALANGWETLDRYGADRPRVEDALNELCAELDRRAGGTGGEVDAEEPAGPRDEIPEPVTESGGGEDDLEAPRSLMPSGTLRPMARLGQGWAVDDDDALWWQRISRAGSVAKAWPGSGWEARHSTGRRVTAGAGPKGRYPSRIKALTALAAEYDRARRERTPHSELPADGLPNGWRLTQTIAEHDDGRWTLRTPGGEIAGTVARETYGGRRAEWRATAGDPATATRLQIPLVTVYPEHDDPARGSDPDLFRTRTAAVRALAIWHTPELADAPHGGGAH